MNSSMPHLRWGTGFKVFFLRGLEVTRGIDLEFRALGLIFFQVRAFRGAGFRARSVEGSRVRARGLQPAGQKEN